MSTHVPGPAPDERRAELVTEIARRLGVSAEEVLAGLAVNGIEIDPDSTGEDVLSALGRRVWAKESWPE